MKKLCFLILLFIAAISLGAQSDSTFVSIYPLDPALHYCWSRDYDWEQAANVFEAWDGSLVLQSSYIVDDDPPPGYILPTYYSPFIIYNRQGEYQNTLLNNIYEFGFLKYKRVIKAEPGFYLGVGEDYFHQPPNIIKLDSNFNGIALFTTILNNGIRIWAKDILAAEDGFVVYGYPNSDYPNLCVLAKFDFAGNELWHKVHNGASFQSFILQNLSDGSIVSVNHNRLMHISATGDSLAYAELTNIYPDRVFMLNNHIFAVEYNNPGLLRFYDLGENLEIANPAVHHEVTVNPMPYFNDRQGYSILTTSDGGYLLFASSSTGEVTKYNSSHQALWSADYVFHECHGFGIHNIIELQNGDFLYCTGVGNTVNAYHLNAFALVRITAEGVPVNDLQEGTPCVPTISVSPNPFSSFVNLEITGKTNKTTAIKVYNLKGQLLDTLSLTNNKTSWLPRNQASGIYVIRLEQDAKVVNTRKVTYLRNN